MSLVEVSVLADEVAVVDEADTPEDTGAFDVILTVCVDMLDDNIVLRITEVAIMFDDVKVFIAAELVILIVEVDIGALVIKVDCIEFGLMDVGSVPPKMKKKKKL